MKLTKKVLKQIIKEELAERQFAPGVSAAFQEIVKLAQEATMNKSLGMNPEIAMEYSERIQNVLNSVAPAQEKDIDIPHAGATVTDPRTGQVMHAKGLKESKGSKK